MKSRIFKFTLSIIIVLSFTFFISAQTEREKGIELYKQGKDLEAIRALQSALKINEKDAEVLNYLGLAYLNTDQYKDGRKALEKAVNLSPQNSSYRSNLAYAYLLDPKTNKKAQKEIEKAILLDSNNANAYFIRGTLNLWKSDFEKVVADADKVIQINKDFTDAYILKSDALVYSFGKDWGEEDKPVESINLLQNAAEVLKSCTENCLDNNRASILKERLKSVEIFYNYFEKRKEKVENTDKSDNVVKTPIKLLVKPQPAYTNAARRFNEKGKVVLAVLFGEDGKIKYVIAVKRLNYGLTEQAMAAARAIKFEPETHDGKPVSVIKHLQYTFSIR